MKFLFVNKYLVDRYLILFIIINIIRQISSPAVPARNAVSLYGVNDKITVLTGQNFSSTVYQSKTAWVIEFYASWCGHCQSYANVGFNSLFTKKRLFFHFS
jgi:thiol-disulfide isomerase/thioredoxin